VSFSFPIKFDLTSNVTCLSVKEHQRKQEEELLYATDSDTI